MPEFFDAHIHFHFPAYDFDREAVLERARAAKIKMVTVGTQFSNSKSAVEIANKYPEEIWATVGFHPGHFSENWHHDKNEQLEPKPENFDPKKLEVLAKEEKVVAIGECGFDYFRLAGEGEKVRQKEAFIAQIEIAKSVKKPLMIHCRSAFPDLIRLLKEKKSFLLGNAGIIHFFSGTKNEAEELLDLGFSFTFGGVITFARDYDEVIKMLPMEAILSETDAPYVSPVPYRGKRNEPAYVVEIVKKLAELKGVELEDITGSIQKNVARVFGIK